MNNYERAHLVLKIKEHGGPWPVAWGEMVVRIFEREGMGPGDFKIFILEAIPWLLEKGYCLDTITDTLDNDVVTLYEVYNHTLDRGAIRGTLNEAVLGALLQELGIEDV